MAGKYSVGKSSYGDLRGVEQFVMTARIALQVLSVIVDFNAWQKARGAVGALSVNEGMRSRVRQTYLWVNRFILGIVVASPFTSRHDEVRHGNAIDFGITMPDGSNRALTAVEFAKLHNLVEKRGGTWTGVNFGEPWHHEMATRAEQLPPYPDAAVLAVPSNPAPVDTSTTAQEEERDMIIVKNSVKGHPGNGAYFTVAPGHCRWLDATQLKRARQATGTKTQHLNAGDTKTLNDILDGFGVDQACADPNWLKRNPTGDGTGLWTRSGANANRILDAIKAVK